MEPRPFVRVSVRALALRLSQPPKPDTGSFHSSSSSSTSTLSSTLTSASASASASSSSSSSTSPSSYFCKVKLSNFESQTVANVPLISSSSSSSSSSENHSITQASFYLDEPTLTKLFSKTSSNLFCKSPHLTITVYGTTPSSSSSSSSSSIVSPCYGNSVKFKYSEKVIGSFLLPVTLDQLANPKEGNFLHNGWVKLNGNKNRLSSLLSPSSSLSSEIHFSVKVELDPRYIFQFDGQPELNPQIVQIQGKVRQPIFSCKFTCDRSFRLRSSQLDGSYGWESSKDNKKERKGWLVLIYDLSGSPVAAASMVTPFVPSTGTNSVSRTNPGAWLIMKAGPRGEDSWMPWGRLEAWRERGGLGSKFQLLPTEGGGGGFNNNWGMLVSESVIHTHKRGEFLIDTFKLKPETPCSASPVDSPQSSGDFHFSFGNALAIDGGGFVMSANVEGEGRKSRPPHVELAMRHVNDTEDAAVFMALAAAVDLSVDACLPFSKKLGKNFAVDSE